MYQKSAFDVDKAFEFYRSIDDVPMCGRFAYSLSAAPEIWSSSDKLVMDKVLILNDIQLVYYYMKANKFLRLDQPARHAVWNCVARRHLVLYGWAGQKKKAKQLTAAAVTGLLGTCSVLPFLKSVPWTAWLIKFSRDCFDTLPGKIHWSPYAHRNSFCLGKFLVKRV